MITTTMKKIEMMNVVAKDIISWYEIDTFFEELDRTYAPTSEKFGFSLNTQRIVNDIVAYYLAMNLYDLGRLDEKPEKTGAIKLHDRIRDIAFEMADEKGIDLIEDSWAGTTVEERYIMALLKRLRKLINSIRRELQFCDVEDR